MENTLEDTQRNITPFALRRCSQCGGPIDKKKRRDVAYCSRRCWKAAYNAAHRTEKAAHDAVYRAAHRTELAAKQAAYYAAHRTELATYRADYQATHRTEQAAKQAAERAYPTTQPCVICGKPGVERHHPNYNKPLEIVWLCRSCHKRLHSGALCLITTRG